MRVHPPGRGIDLPRPGGETHAKNPPLRGMDSHPLFHAIIGAGNLESTKKSRGYQVTISDVACARAMSAPWPHTTRGRPRLGTPPDFLVLSKYGLILSRQHRRGVRPRVSVRSPRCAIGT